MKKVILMVLVLNLVACSRQNTPDFILKRVDLQAYEQKQAAEYCNAYSTNRVIQIDGVSGFYDYSAGDDQACIIADEEVLQPYQEPQRHGAHRNDIYPIGKTN